MYKMTKRKQNCQTHNDLQVSYVILNFAVFKKLSQKGSYKMVYFVFKTLKLLALDFQFWKVLEDKCPVAPSHPPLGATALLLQTLEQTAMQIFYVLFFHLLIKKIVSLILCNKCNIWEQ